MSLESVRFQQIMGINSSLLGSRQIADEEKEIPQFSSFSIIPRRAVSGSEGSVSKNIQALFNVLQGSGRACEMLASKRRKPCFISSNGLDGETSA